MIKKHWVEFILPKLLVLSIGILIGVIIRNIDYIDYSDKIKHLENEVEEAYDKGYSDGENYAFIDFMEDYYEILIENAVLKERLKNQPSNEDGTTSLDTYDYYLLIVVSRQRQSKDSFVYVLREAGTTDTIAYESDELWSVGEFVIAIEIDEEGNVYYTDLNVTTDVILGQCQEQILDDFELLFELQEHYYQENITSHIFGDWLRINYPALYERILNYY